MTCLNSRVQVRVRELRVYIRAIGFKAVGSFMIRIGFLFGGLLYGSLCGSSTGSIDRGLSVGLYRGKNDRIGLWGHVIRT